MSFHAHAISPGRRAAFVVLLALLTSACNDKPSKSEAEGLIAKYVAFRAPKTVRVPRRIVLRSAGYASSYSKLRLDWDDFAQIDWVTQSMEQMHVVRVADNARMATGPSESYDHYIDVYPTPEALESGDFVEDEDDPPPTPWGPPNKVPGWKVAVAHRKLDGVTEILDHTATTETVVRGQAVAYFDFKWVATKSGFAYDQATSEFASLRRGPWAAARQLNIDSRIPLRAKALFFQDKNGRWYVRAMECGRCGGFDPVRD
jgi:hypothetical protein